MRSILFAIGLLTLPLVTHAAGLYDMFRDQVKSEQAAFDVDPTIVEFIRGVYEPKWKLTAEEVTAAIQGKPWLACGVDSDSQEQGDSGNSNIIECNRALKNIQLLASEEQQLRTFGRTLQRLGTAQELPLSEVPGRPFHLATDLSGIINIWRAGTGSVRPTASGAALLRTWTPQEGTAAYDQLQSVIDEFAERYEQLTTEERNALMVRYQYGVRLVRGERSPLFPPQREDDQSAPGTERQYVFKQWDDIEGMLKSAWQSLPNGSALNPPLSQSEAAYVLLPDALQQRLPANVLLWLRIGPYEQGGNDKVGDVGLQWMLPIDPLLPSLVSDEEENKGAAILGGRYPPEPAYAPSSDSQGNPLADGTTLPIDGTGLCSMPLAARGYLCRNLTVANATECPATTGSQGQSDDIRLISCTTEEQPTLTVAGADVCSEIEWKSGEQPQRCTVLFEQGNCGVGGPGLARDKEPDGTLRVCLDDSFNVALTYVMEHEMVHAQQFCSMPAGNVYAGLTAEKADSLCCRLEGEAHLVSCKRMYDDGVLQKPDGSPIVIDGVEISAQTCMELSRLRSCEGILGRPVSCPSSTKLTIDDAPALEAAIGGKNPKNLPNTYEEATDPETMDARVAARLRAIEQYDPVCTPGTESTYKNTIGNNACYIGQCVEQSLELHRLTGGRSPVGVGDSAFPYDDPSSSDALGTVLRSVPVTTPTLPSYRPQLIMNILDQALCQLQGLPATTPPHLCAFSPSRRLGLPLSEGVATTQSLIFNTQEQADATVLTEALAAALGSRIGTDLQGQYLRIGTRTLSEVVALANSLLKDTTTITFPTNMCPLSNP